MWKSGWSLFGLLLTAYSVQAQQISTPIGVSFDYGVGEQYQRATVNYETPTIWSYRLKNSWGRIDLAGEFGASYWWADDPRTPDQSADKVWQISAIPMFRWLTASPLYLEMGIGPTIFSRTRFAGESISTAFQFGDHLGLGLLIGQNTRIRLRYSHFSNASIKKPNPGLDIVQFTYSHTF